jgi:hypothetical protein
MLTIDYANCLSERVGSHGIDAALLAPGGPGDNAIKAATARLAKSFNTGWERWRGLCDEPVRSTHLAAVNAVVDRCKGNAEAIKRVGIHWATEQCRDLLDHGVKGIHFYTLNKSSATREIYASLGMQDSLSLA